MLGPKKFRVQNNFGFEKIWVQKSFGSPEFLLKKNNLPKKLLANNCFGQNERLGKRCRYRDSIETLVDLCIFLNKKLFGEFWGKDLTNKLKIKGSFSL